MELETIIAILNPTLIVPTVMFITVGTTTIVGLFVWLRNKQAQQETMRMAIQANQKLDEQTIKLLTRPTMSPEMDMRQGIIGTCLAVGFAIAALFSTNMSKQGDLVTVIGMVAIVIASGSIGQLIAWKVRDSISKAESENTKTPS